MKLYTLPGAPNPTKVMLYIAEKRELGGQLDIEQIVVNVFKGEQRSPAHLARNPFGQMPVLETDEGQYIFESLPIIEYLEDLEPQPSLLGATAGERARRRTLERVADVRGLGPSATYVHATNSPLPLEPNPAAAASAEATFRKTFAYFDDLLGDGREWLTGDEVSVADCTMQGALQFMRFRELEDLTDYPRLAAWSERYRERPAAKAVLHF